MTITIRCTKADGTPVEAQGQPGESLLRAAQAAGMPLEGTCEGQMACSTCHVILPRAWFDLLPAPRPEEEDMLDLAAGARATSRLSCQIELAEALDGIEVTIPPEAHDMSR